MASIPDWQWATGAGGSGVDYGNSIITDASGNVYATGEFGSDSISFGSITLYNQDLNDIFVVKYNPAGNVVWAKSFGGNKDDFSKSIALDENGNVYITGSFVSDSISFGNFKLFNCTHHYYIISDIFIAKLDPNGEVIWAIKEGGEDADEGTGIKIDQAGNIFLTGDFCSQTITFGNITLTNSAVGKKDVFLVKFDSNANVLWAKSIYGTKNENVTGIALDGSGNICITGYFNSLSITFNNTTLYNTTTNGNNIFIAKYNTNGNVIWAKSAGGIYSDTDIQSRGIATDSDGNMYITGHFYNWTITFDNITLTSSGWEDIFIVKYNADGNVAWAKNPHGEGREYGFAIATDVANNIYITGSFWGDSVTFDSITIVNKRSNVFGDNMYIAKYNSNGDAQMAASSEGLSSNWGRAISACSEDKVATIGVFHYSYIVFGQTMINMHGGSSSNEDIFTVKLSTTASSNSPLCEGSDLKLYASATEGTTYYWTGPEGFTSVLQNPVIQNAFPSMSGTYYLTKTVNGNIISDSVYVVVNATPPSPEAENNGPVCEGHTIVLTASSIPNATYQWTGPNGYTNNTQNVTISWATQANAGTYYVTATVNRCTSATDSTMIIIKTTPPRPEIGHSWPVCDGGSLSLTASSIPNATYQWTGPNGFTSTEQNPLVSDNITMAMAGFYTVVATVDGCQSQENDINIEVIHNYPPNCSYSNPICEGSYLQLFASSSIWDATFQWTGPNGFSSTEQNPLVSYNATPDMSGYYYATVTANGCTSLPDSVPVTINVMPPLATPGSNSPVCVGSKLTLTALDIPGAIYRWYGPNNFYSAEQNPIVSDSTTNAMAGTYSVNAIVNECSSGWAYTNVYIYSLPAIPEITQVGKNLVSSPATAYQWYLDNNILTNDTLQIYTPVQGGNFSVETTDDNGCRAMSNPFNFANGINDIDNDNLVIISPNPASTGKFNIKFPRETQQIQIINTNGQILNRKNVEYETTADFTINGKGVYYIQIITAKTNITKKIIIE